MKILKNLFLYSILMLSIFYTENQQGYYDQREYFCPNKTLKYGTIQFPKTISAIPDIRIYYSGQRIKCEINNELKRITYAIPDFAHKPSFKLLITDELEYVAEYNVIKYLKVREGASYKYYQLDLSASMQRLCSLEQPYEAEANGTQPIMSWFIREYRNTLAQGRIPDDTIIICCKSSYIDHLENTKAPSLPIIKIRPDILDLIGSEKRMHESFDELILTLIDYDTIHAAMQHQEVRPISCQKTILSITT